MTSKLIKNIEEFRKAAYNTQADFAISLNHGAFSRKEVYYHPTTDTFEILNCIDGTMQNLNSEEIFDTQLTNIGRAITDNAFYQLSYD